MNYVHFRIYRNYREMTDDMQYQRREVILVNHGCFDYDCGKKRREFGRISAEALKAGHVVVTYTCKAHDSEES